MGGAFDNRPQEFNGEDGVIEGDANSAEIHAFM